MLVYHTCLKLYALISWACLDGFIPKTLLILHLRQQTSGLRKKPFAYCLHVETGNASGNVHHWNVETIKFTNRASEAAWRSAVACFTISENVNEGQVSKQDKNIVYEPTWNFSRPEARSYKRPADCFMLRKPYEGRVPATDGAGPTIIGHLKADKSTD